MNYTAFTLYLDGSRKLVEGKKADLIAAIKNRESKVKDPDNDIRLAGMRTRLDKMPDDVAKAVRGDTNTPIKKLMRANRPKGVESDKAFQARLAANTKKLPPEEEKDNRSEREQEADKNAKRRATLTAAEREAEDDADAAERSKEQDESQRNYDETQKDDDEREENRRREDLSPEDRKAEDQNKAAVSKKNKERKDRYEKLTPKQKGAYNDRGGFKDDPWALGPDSVSDKNKDPLDETTRQYKTFRETLQAIIESTNRQNITEGFAFSTKQAKAAAKQLGVKLLATTVGSDTYEGFEYHLLQKGDLFSIVSYQFNDYSGYNGNPGLSTVKAFIAQTKTGNHNGEGQFQSKQALLSNFSDIFDSDDKEAEAFMRSKLK